MARTVDELLLPQRKRIALVLPAAALLHMMFVLPPIGELCVGRPLRCDGGSTAA